MNGIDYILGIIIINYHQSINQSNIHVEGEEIQSLLISTTVHQELGIANRLVKISTSKLRINKPTHQIKECKIQYNTIQYNTYLTLLQLVVLYNRHLSSLLTLGTAVLSETVEVGLLDELILLLHSGQTRGNG